MCNGDGCPMKRICFRFTAIPSSRQSYFIESPNDGVVCDHFVMDLDVSG